MVYAWAKEATAVAAGVRTATAGVRTATTGVCTATAGVCTATAGVCITTAGAPPPMCAPRLMSRTNTYIIGGKKFILIGFQGSGFLSDAATNGTLIVLIGSGRCQAVERFENLITCIIHKKKPTKGDHDTEEGLAVQVSRTQQICIFINNMSYITMIIYIIYNYVSVH